MVLIFSEFLIFDQIFVSPQLKKSLIISANQDIFELPQELPRDLGS